MQLTCPCCAGRFSIEAALADERARAAVAAAARLPAPLGDLVLRYIGLFRPAKRALSWDRAARLIEDLLGPIRAGQVQRHGRLWPAPQDAWRAALEAVIAARDAGKLRTPLTGHAYLLEILASQANRTEAAAETAIEAERQAGRGPQRATPAAPPEAPRTAGPQSTAQVLAHLDSLRRGLQE